MITVTGESDALLGRIKKEGIIAVMGFFDGVHKGHKKLFDEALKIKKATGRKILVVTFYPHPQTYVSGNNDKWKLLTPPYERSYVINRCGVDYYWSIHFTAQFAATSPEDFIKKYLVDLLAVKHVVCGFDFSYGHKGRGNPEMLEQLGNELGYSVSIVPPCTVGNVVVSSTKIRDCLAAGDIVKTREYLGRPYCIYGKVESGTGRGGKLGRSTANLSIPGEKLLPCHGVYIGWLRFTSQSEFKENAAMVYIGTRPAFSLNENFVEVHIPGFCGDLYGEKMAVLLTDFIRPEIKFECFGDVLKARFQRGSFTGGNLYDRIFLQNLP